MGKKSIKEGFEKRTVHSNPKPATEKPKPGSNVPPPPPPSPQPNSDSGQRSSRDD